MTPFWCGHIAVMIATEHWQIDKLEYVQRLLTLKIDPHAWRRHVEPQLFCISDKSIHYPGNTNELV